MMAQFLNRLNLLTILITLFTLTIEAKTPITLGIDTLFDGSYDQVLSGKNIGLITNHTGVNGKLEPTVDILKKEAKNKGYTLKAIFAPEHGLNGQAYAGEKVSNKKHSKAIPIYSLHGKTRRPTAKMLKGIDLLIYDIQDIGSRSYTYVSTLFYVMEEAAKYKILVIVADRPNPMGGLSVDGPMLDPKWRTFLGYINIPYCHGMTVGELAQFFNEEYKIGCELTVVPIKGWKRNMTFEDTGLTWVPTSPYIPEPNTPFFYPTTGILGELGLVNIGIGYTMPFKLVGAPWINAKKFSAKLNAQKLPGVHFQPFHFRPFYGRFAKQNCQGVRIIITDPKKYRPVATGYLLIGLLKSLYPKQFDKALMRSTKKKQIICKVTGTEEVFRIIQKDKYIAWKLISLHEKERKEFLKQRKKYLIKTYQ